MVKKVVTADDEECRSLVRETENQQSSSDSSSSSSSSSSKIWKVLFLIVVGILVLFATDSVEIKKKYEAKQYHDALPFGGAEDVEMKTPNSAGTEDSISPPDGSSSSTGGQISPSTNDEPDASRSAETPPKDNDSNLKTASEQDAATTTPKRHSYVPRGRTMSEEDRQAMIDKWGSWTLVDHKERPPGDFYKEYPNRDIPRNEFPSSAWQLDQEYMSQFLPESMAMVQRAQDAILAEYGQNDTEMFRIEFLDDELKEKGATQGGWTTPKSWDGLKKRILHAIMTEDYFVFAMGGHSASAGHGNHFQQSYTLQVQWILEAVFARLGVRHVSRNFGNGGLGTVHNGLAAGSIYGGDVDVLMWDSGMTEKDNKAKDLFARQALLGGTKVPVLWSLATGVSKALYLAADADIGMPGEGRYGIPKGGSYEEINKMPWAAQYVSCTSEFSSICRQNEYNGTCWIDRDDYTPTTKQQKEPGGRAKWHPGNRKHQVRGRVLAFTFLQALKEVLEVWNGAEGYELPDDAWHVTAHYKNIRTKVAALGPEVGWCSEYETKGLGFLCNYPMQARNEFTPRAYPPLTNLRTLMPPEMAANIDAAEKNVYNAPDVFNPTLHPPLGAVDVLSIVEAGIVFDSILAPSSHAAEFYKKPKFENPPKVPIGKGINLDTQSGDDFCDGSVDSFCSRGIEQTCLLRAHNDGRNGLCIDSYSGWLVLNLPDLKNGFVVVKYESWHQPGKAYKTKGWKSINNEEGRRRQEHQEPVEFSDSNYNTTTISSDNRDWEVGSSHKKSRGLKNKAPDTCDEFHFEYAIDGKVTSLNRTEWEQRRDMGHIQRVVETLVLLNDPNYTGGEEREVEVAVRVTGCAQAKSFRVSHIYWS